MTVFGVSMVRDELDVIEGTLRHLADEAVDHLIVADNGSTDGTRELLDDLSHELPLTVVDDHEVGYYQSEKMSRLAAMAGDAGATWVVPFDADEVWVYRGDRLAAELGLLEADIVWADLYHHFPSAVDPAGKDPFRTIVWRQPRPAPLPKVAFRYREGAVVHQGNHGVTLPGSNTAVPGLEVRHFPYRSVEQFVRKARNGAAAYAATDLPESAGAHWRGYGRILAERGEEGLAEVFDRYFWNLSPADADMVLDPAPYMRWQLP
jgi:hypothetical protein